MKVSCFNVNSPEIVRLNELYGNDSHFRLEGAIAYKQPFMIKENGKWVESKEFNSFLKQTNGDFEKAGDMLLDSIKADEVSPPIEENILPSDNKSPEKELIRDLLKIVQDNGFNVDTVENLMTSKGIPARGLVDMVNKMIVLSKDDSDMTDFTEEVSHLLIAMLKGTKLYTRLYDNTKPRYKEVLGNNLESYEKEYDGDVEKLTIEAMGKLLRTSLLNEYSNLQSPKDSGLKSIIQRFWGYAKGVFKKISPSSFNRATNTAFDKLAKSIRTREDVGFNKENIDDSFDKLYSAEEESVETDKDLDFLKKQIEQAILDTDKRIEYYQRVGRENITKTDESRLQELKEYYNDKKYEEGLVTFLENSQNKLTKFIGRIREIRDELSNTDKFDIKKSASMLRDMKMYTNTYSPTIKSTIGELSKAKFLDEENENIKTMLNKANDINATITTIENIYEELAIPVVAKFLKPFTGNSKSNITKLLSDAQVDVGLIDRFMNSMSASSDEVVQLLATTVRKAKMESESASLDTMKDILDIKFELEKNGIKNTDWMYDGSNFVSMFKMDKYHNNIATARTSSLKDVVAMYLDGKIKTDEKYELTTQTDPSEALSIITNDVKLNAEYSKRISTWYRENSEPIDSKSAKQHREVVERIAKSRMTEKQFEDWKADRTKTGTGGRTYYTKELSAPKHSKYGNPKFDDIMNNKHKNKAYWQLMEIYGKSIAMLPTNAQPSIFLAPQVRKSDIERVLSAKGKGMLTQLKDIVGEKFGRVEGETEYGAEGVKSKLDINMVPVYYTNRLESSQNLSKNATDAIIFFNAMANNYSKMNDVVDLLELSKDVVGIRGVAEKDSRGNILIRSIDDLKNKITKVESNKNQASKTVELINKMMEMQVYGKTKVRGKTVLGMDSEKLIDGFIQYTSICALGFSVYASIANVVAGTNNIKIEAAAGQFVDVKSLTRSQAEILKSFPAMALEAASVDKGRQTNNRIKLWSEYMNVLQEHSGRTLGGSNRRSIVSRLLDTSTIYFGFSLGEFEMQNRTSIALGYNYRFNSKTNDFEQKDSFYRPIEDLKAKRKELAGNKDITKEEYNAQKLKIDAEIKKTTAELDAKWDKMPNWYDSHEVKNHRMALKPDIKSKLKDYDATKFRFISRQNKLSDLMHGFHNELSRPAMQQYALGRLVLQFRNHIVPGAIRRFKKEGVDVDLGGIKTKGYYNPFLKFTGNFIKEVRQRNMTIARYWDTFSENDKKDIARSSTEITHMLAAIMIGHILLGLDWDDDDEGWMANMACYQILRAQTEIGFYMVIPFPGEALNMIKAPIAGASSLETLSDALNLVTAFKGERYEKGTHKGEFKSVVSLKKAVPFVKTAEGIMSPSDKIKFFNM